MSDFFTAARYICNPLASPNWPALPSDYYDTPAEIRARFVERRQEEIANDPIEMADAIAMYLEQKPATVVEAIKKACGGTLVAAIELQDMLDKAVDTYIDHEWKGASHE